MPIPMGTALLCAIQKAGWKIGSHLAIVLHVSYVSLLCRVWHGPIPNLGLVTSEASVSCFVVGRELDSKLALDGQFKVSVPLF